MKECDEGEEMAGRAKLSEGTGRHGHYETGGMRKNVRGIGGRSNIIQVRIDGRC